MGQSNRMGGSNHIRGVSNRHFSALAAYNSRRLVTALVHSQRLSVRPIGVIILDDYEDRIAVIIENRGTGPMLIDEFCVLRDGKVVVKNSLVYAGGLPFDENYTVNFVAGINGIVLLPTQTVLLLQAEGSATDESFTKYRTSLREYLSKLTFQVKYHDVYQKSQAPTVRTGAWFARHAQSSARSP
jgi:hypothetical protein